MMFIYCEKALTYTWVPMRARDKEAGTAFPPPDIFAPKILLLTLNLT